MKNVCSDNHKSAPVDKNVTMDATNTTEKYRQALLAFERLGDDARDAIWRTHALGDVLRMPTTEFLTMFEEISSAPRCGQIWENRKKRVVVFYVNSKNTVFYYTVSGMEGMEEWMNVAAFLDTYSYTGRICKTAERFLQDFRKLQTTDWASVGENVYDSVAPHEYSSAPETGEIWRHNSDDRKVIIGATWHSCNWMGITYNHFYYSSTDFCSDSVEVRTNDVCSDNTTGHAFLKNYSFTGYKYETMVSFMKELKELKQNGGGMQKGVDCSYGEPCSVSSSMGVSVERFSSMGDGAKQRF